MLPIDIVRAAYCWPKQAYIDNCCLDLSYITPKIIVAAGPADSPTERLYRTPILNLIAHLDKHHTNATGRHWCIWNLRLEKVGYDPTLFEDNWRHRPFPDRHPPSLQMMMRLVREITEFLAADQQNVAVVHCKEGKGRLCTVVSALLMYEALLAAESVSAIKAVEFVTTRRMRSGFGPSVSISSQTKYLKYWQRYLEGGEVMRKDFHRFHSANHPRPTTFLTIKVRMPAMFLLCEQIEVWTYQPVKKGIQMTELYVHLIKGPMVGLGAYTVELEPNKDITGVTDLCIILKLTQGSVCTWFNLYFETFSEHQPSPEGRVEGECVLKWDEFSSFAPTKPRAYHLVDQVEIGWKYH